MKFESHSSSIYIQYSIDGGIKWETIDTLDAESFDDSTRFIVIQLPNAARTVASRIRWFQPFSSNIPWALDQVDSKKAYKYMYACAYTYTDIYLHRYTNAYIRPCVHRHIHSYILTCLHTCIYGIYIYIYIYKHVYIYIYT